MQSGDEPNHGDRNSVRIRTTLQPGDLGTIVALHGEIYAAEHGFDHTFEAYVAGPLAEFAIGNSSRERLWIAERDGGIVGCIAVVAESEMAAQLRWFLVIPAARCGGLGTWLLNEAVRFAKDAGYERMILWTTNTLAAAARLYLAAGFDKTESHARRCWGCDVVEEKYAMRLR